MTQFLLGMPFLIFFLWIILVYAIPEDVASGAADVITEAAVTAMAGGTTTTTVTTERPITTAMGFTEEARREIQVREDLSFN